MTSAPTAINRRILIVDDNEDIHRDFQQVLSGTSEAERALAATHAALFGDTETIVREGFDVNSAYQGQQALEMASRALAEGRPYAMAFVDMRMPPGWDGITTIEQLWRCDPRLQVAICSAYSDYSWEDIAARLDLRDRLLILKKPFDNIEIYQLASSLTAKWQMASDATARMTNLEAAVEERTRGLQAANKALQAEVNERRRLEAQLALRQKLESIGQLAAGVAHEINTPIQYIGDSVYFLGSAFADIDTLYQRYEALLGAQSGGVRAAMEEARSAADLSSLREEIPRACERALDGVNRVATIVRAMKEFAHAREHETGPADINEALNSTLIVTRSEYRGVAQLETRFGELPPVVCNIGELNQVFLNLIVNAAHAVEAAGKDAASGRILVTTAVDGQHVVITIGDNGSGIPESIAERIYDPFFTTKEVGRGTGQGLAIAFAIVVKHHQGTLSFDTQLGVGTTFKIRLPIAGASGNGEEQIVVINQPDGL
jgi:two-component system, NtrC family, sensor kinase